MDVTVVSRALAEAHVWHKIDRDLICTRRTRTRIPEINDAIAYLAGVIAGDGNLNKCKRKKGGYYYRVNITGHEEDLRHLVKMINDLFNYDSHIHKDKRKMNCYYTNIHNAAIYFYFLNLGFPSGKKTNLRVPETMVYDSNLFKHFLLGLIDTDGSISKNRVQLKQRDKTFLEQIVELLKTRLGVESNPPKVNYTNGKPFYYIRFQANTLYDNLTNTSAQ